ncbi:methylenetetrahydrofolate--tRNA-(uracil(54)-C(5))-methyltransferase (FADH(2)-oxidizing) TrmFO [Spiroplasma chrysopicola]|uniref:Methylenetetrahydrofolate--tRNA-(uracil-5-)-methyltransferase TrmFO n=1 Tax=Spiroplasma chrysopicola DF-1 TaxID=1276227 RepID=R4U2P1_9MOLU|nr:methylenetetrahydrofolate--tRNA-(uracil(54)-C(5))-methyltransferase (FADH(2)-oxidizing) TrmFO [Spiroplasma chrysopicola]AGM24733.1 tRNA (uracil-5-)-methyltransferase Gid [Spiroplasma chrysopicola DF-1]
MKIKEVNIIGAGLAGCEIAYQLAKRGIKVNLYEGKTVRQNPVQKLATFAELVCSNTFRSKSKENAVGILKYELELLDSFILKMARQNQLPADDALAVDRVNFSNDITTFLKNHPLITIYEEEFLTINPREVTVIATGPLSSPSWEQQLETIIGKKNFYYYDGSAPIINKVGIDFTKVYYQNRHNQEKDYLICPMTKTEFELLHQQLVTAETVGLTSFEKYFKGCQPIEVLAKTSPKILLNGPMNPNHLAQDGHPDPYAVVQLRQDDVHDSLYNLVGWQTNLTWPEQKRIINNYIPGLSKAVIHRYGVLHKNNYINSPKLLNPYLQYKANSNIFFAGQITGVEGYLESAACGLACALNIYQYLTNQPLIQFPNETVLGALLNYVTNPKHKVLKPMKANIGLLPTINGNFSDKKTKNLAIYERAIIRIKEIVVKYHLNNN